MRPRYGNELVLVGRIGEENHSALGMWIMNKLSPLQEEFVRQYLLDLNATAAAARAGYSARTANQKGPALLRNSRVAAAIEAAKAERVARAKVDADWVLKRLVEEVEADLADLYDKETGDLLPVARWPQVWRNGLVAGIEMRVTDECTTVTKVRLTDRVKRLELIGKHIGVQAFSDVVRHDGLDGLAERLERAGRRLAREDR